MAPFWIHAGVADRARPAERVEALHGRGWSVFDAVNLRRRAQRWTKR